ncbi:MAG: hypothetical protein QUS11_09680 [Candidatus Fermentibacter sp.]|nr:hypothetical protein [Candidatus Fermentibacter sp.]
MRCIALAMILTGSVVADQVLMDFDFTQQPPGWTMTGTSPWTFPGHAHCDLASWGGSDWAELFSDSITVPDGVEHLLIEIPMTIEMLTMNGYTTAWIRCYVNGSSQSLLSISSSAPSYSYSDTLVADVYVSPGDMVSFWFRGAGMGDPVEYGYGSTVWDMYHFTVTAFTSDLEPSTWARMKACIF